MISLIGLEPHTRAVIMSTMAAGPARRADFSPSDRTANASRWARIPAFKHFTISRHRRQWPPRYALRADRALPSAVRGPVDCSHGRHRLIARACRARRFGVQPFAIRLQLFVSLGFRIFRARDLQLGQHLRVVLPGAPRLLCNHSKPTHPLYRAGVPPAALERAYPHVR